MITMMITKDDDKKLKDHIQVMFDLALTRQKEETQTLVNQVMEKQREETRMELQAYAIQQR